MKRVPNSQEPTVTSVLPQNGATGIDSKQTLRATFDKPIDPSTLDSTTFLLTGPGGVALSGSVAYDPGSQTAVFTPMRGLSSATIYSGKLTRGIKSENKSPLAVEYLWHFTTAGLPAVAFCPEGTRFPYVAFETSTTATLAWKCIPDAVVEWGISPNYTFRFEEHAPGNKHFVTLTDLAPDTLYAYRVSVQGRVLGEGAFRTAKAAGDNQFTFVVFGDSGTGSPEQVALAFQIEKIHPAFGFVTGDVIYEAGYDPEFDPNYFIPYQRFINRIPFFPVAGDHDLVADDGATFMENFFHPTGKLYYDFHWGDTHLIALDSTHGNFHSPDPQQLAWLEQTLAQSQARWKIVYFHHPPYNSGIFGNAFQEVRDQFVPLFEKYHVDVVFTGHAHDYERTCSLLKGGCTIDGSGVTYIVTGGGGAYLTTPPPKPPCAQGVPCDNPFTAQSKSVFHILVGKMTEGQLTLQAIDPNGVPFDSITLNK